MINEVLGFAKDFINNPDFRTKERKEKIRNVYKSLTGENLQLSCFTCYIEAILKIKKIMENKPCRYLLKPGALLQAFGDASKTCTNVNLTDELAEWHLNNNPGLIKLFSRVPEAPAIPWTPPGKMIILNPQTNEAETKEKQIQVEREKAEKESKAAEEKARKEKEIAEVEIKKTFVKPGKKAKKK
jgi:hypothetical protein